MFKEKVKSTIAKYSLFPEGSRILVALSGGPDSVALLGVLLELSPELNISLAALHVNHLLRGEESFRDEDFVRRLCKELSVPLFVERVNVKELSRGKSLEEAAREVRYSLFKEYLKRWKGDFVALGHTASDLVETVLLNLTKGAGVRGLRGFLPKRDFVVRPLFEVTRKEVESYLKERALPFVVDSSNYQLDYERNLIRHKVVPVLKSVNPSLEKAVLRSSEVLREVEDFISSQVEPLLNKFLKGATFSAPLSELRDLHPLLKKELLQRAFKRIAGRALSYEKLNQLLKIIDSEGYKEFRPSKDFIFYKDQEKLVLTKWEPQGRGGFSFEVKELPKEVRTPLGSLRFYKGRGAPIASLDEFNQKGIIVRSRKPGDRLAFKGFSKSLKKFLIEKRVPARERELLPLVLLGEEVVFIPNLYAREFKPKGDFVGVEFEPESSN
jgi:tRNA(Ile)-lysidine synthase